MKALFLAPESPYPANGGGPLRSACMLEWLARRAEVSALVCSEPEDRVREICHRVEVAQLPHHSRHLLARVQRNLERAIRQVPPLVDRYSCREVQEPLERLLEDGPFDAAIFEHFWLAPWIHLVRPHCEMAILDLHNHEGEFYRSHGGPLAFWMARCAERWERDLLPEFDQVWDPFVVPSGLPWRDESHEHRAIDVAFSARWDYPPNQDAVQWFFKSVWPHLLARRPEVKIALIGRGDEHLPRFVRDLSKSTGRVTITGPVDSSTAWLEHARVAIAPLRRGAGVSVKIAEAWRAGCAVVATSVGARGYLPRGYQPNGGIELADDPVGFASAISGLLLDSAFCREVARAGRKRYEESYSWSAVHQRLDRLAPELALYEVTQ